MILHLTKRGARLLLGVVVRVIVLGVVLLFAYALLHGGAQIGRGAAYVFHAMRGQ